MKNKLLVMTSVVLLLAMIFVGCGAQNTNANVKEGHEDNDEHHEHAEDHPHGAYEWMGEFELNAGTYLFHFGASEDETMDVAFVKLGENITDLEHHVGHVMASEKDVIKQDSTFDAKSYYAYTLEMNEDHGHIHFNIAEDGIYVIATQHLPEENSMQIFAEDKKEILPVKEYEVKGHSH